MSELQRRIGGLPVTASEKVKQERIAIDGEATILKFGQKAERFQEPIFLTAWLTVKPYRPEDYLNKINGLSFQTIIEWE